MWIQVILPVVFLAGYAGIALEHKIHIDKAATALFIGALSWTITALNFPLETVHTELKHHLSDISEILFFLIGAMTIVELIDTHGGFSLITERITTREKRLLLILLSIIAFFMSSVLDNLTTTIVMATLLKKMIPVKRQQWIFAGMLIIAANAGGAWSPIGDVTTIMLWIGGQITATNIMLKLILPSMVAMVVPLLFFLWKMEGRMDDLPIQGGYEVAISRSEKRSVLLLGLGALLFVPFFKMVTHLPPYIGIVGSLSVMWIYTEIIHRKKHEDHRFKLSIRYVLEKIDTTSILFFLGILLAVAALETVGHLETMAGFLDSHFGNVWLINGAIGLLSSVVDNVPLVAGAMGMYSLSQFPADNLFWELLAYCAGTGGSILIIGSAAGVAAMGILKIDFIWYFKRVSTYAFIGYLAGIVTYWLLQFAAG